MDVVLPMTAPAHVSVRGSRLMAVISRPSVIRLGGTAGLLAPLPVWGAAAISLAVGPNLRQYGFHWAAALAAVLAGACTIALTGAHAGRWRRGLQVIGVITTGALLGVATFTRTVRSLTDWSCPVALCVACSDGVMV